MARNQNTDGRTGSWRPMLIIALICGVVVLVAMVIGAFFVLSLLREEVKTPDKSKIASGPFRDLTAKPKPYAVPFKGCPAEGDGGDPVLNTLKNRVDEGNYVAVQFDEVETIQWPPTVERKHRSTWTSADSDEVAIYEGRPISVEGYLVGTKEEGPESPNCHGEESQFHDFHLWLAGRLEEDRRKSIVVEMTPPVRAKHPAWRIDRLKQIVSDREQVRVSGWLMLDPEHANQVGQSRGTIWEIHPVMKFEVERQGQWRTLDDLD